MTILVNGPILGSDMTTTFFLPHALHCLLGRRINNQESEKKNEEEAKETVNWKVQFNVHL